MEPFDAEMENADHHLIQPIARFLNHVITILENVQQVMNANKVCFVKMEYANKLNFMVAVNPDYVPTKQGFDAGMANALIKQKTSVQLVKDAKIVKVNVTATMNARMD